MQARRLVAAASKIEPGEARLTFNRIAFGFLHSFVGRRSLVEIAKFHQCVPEQGVAAAFSGFDFGKGRSEVSGGCEMMRLVLDAAAPEQSSRILFRGHRCE